MRRRRLKQPHRAVAQLQPHFAGKGEVSQGHDDGLVIVIFPADTRIHRQKDFHAFPINLFLERFQMGVGLFVGQAQAVHDVHPEGVIPVPVGQHRETRQGQPGFLQGTVKLLRVRLGVPRVHG